jgi:hypothetical protein
VKLWIDGDGPPCDPATLPVLGEGGEATVHELGARALKLYKGPKHPDIAGDAAREAAAAARLASAEARLSAFPAGLPPRVAAPRALVRAARRRAVVGYVMDRVGGRPLYELGEPRLRRGGGVDLDHLVAALRDLHGTVTALHAAGVVIGDFNDGNVLVDGVRAHVIDADSFAWGAWACPMFTERFVDPRLCDPAAPAPALVRAHDELSDWFAYAVMLFRTLCWVGPFGGVHQPADPARRVAPAARPLRGPSVFSDDVIYPRAAAPLAVLSDELIDHFSAVFEGGARAPFPPALLDRLRLRRCTTCGVDHTRSRCPACTRQVVVPATHGDLTVVPLDPQVVTWGAREIGSASTDAARRHGALWTSGSALWHQGHFGPEQLGQIVPGATRLWVGERLGAGLWRAGGYAVALTFTPGRRGIDDRARLPALRGRVLAQGCVLGDDRAWLWWRETDGARERLRVVVVGAGRVLAQAEADASDPGWLAGIAGACATGAMLLVPTDDGIVRVEPGAAGADRVAALDVTRRFTDTRALVSAGDDLAAVAGGLAVRKAGAPLLVSGTAARAVRLTFTTRAPRAGGT